MGVGEEDQGPNSSKAAVRRQLEHFFRSFRKQLPYTHSLSLVYRDLLYQERLKSQDEKAVLNVDLQDIRDHDEELGRQVERTPMQLLPLLEEAAARVMRELRAYGQGNVEPELSEVQVRNFTTRFAEFAARQITLGASAWPSMAQAFCFSLSYTRTFMFRRSHFTVVHPLGRRHSAS